MEKYVTIREADNIADLAFVGGRTNRRFRDKFLLDYVPPLLGKLGPETCDVLGIQIETELLSPGRYHKDFLVKGRKRIGRVLNRVLGTST